MADILANTHYSIMTTSNRIISISWSNIGIYWCIINIIFSILALIHSQIKLHLVYIHYETLPDLFGTSAAYDIMFKWIVDKHHLHMNIKRSRSLLSIGLSIISIELLDVFVIVAVLAIPSMASMKITLESLGFCTSEPVLPVVNVINWCININKYIIRNINCVYK
eukprot:469190_1